MYCCHQKSRADYTCFGDVVTFDTTYKSNLYEMPVGMFIGVNNHYQCCVFGCVVLREETVESFEWAYETFLSSVDNKVPKTFLTGKKFLLYVQSNFYLYHRHIYVLITLCLHFSRPKQADGACNCFNHANHYPQMVQMARFQKDEGKSGQRIQKGFCIPHRV